MAPPTPPYGCWWCLETWCNNIILTLVHGGEFVHLSWAGQFLPPTSTAAPLDDLQAWVEEAFLAVPNTLDSRTLMAV